MFKKAWMFVPLFLYAGILSAEDVVMRVKQVTFENGGRSESVTAVSISGEKIRTDMEGESNYFIFRGDKELMWIVDTDNQEYFEIDEETLENMMAKINPAMEKMRRQLEALAEEQRAMAEKMMEQRMKDAGMEQHAELTYNATGQNKIIGEYPCTQWEVFRGSEKIEELWVTDWRNLEYREELETSFNALSEFVVSLQKAFQQFPMASDVSMPLDYSKRAELNGIPVSTAHYENGEMTDKSTLQDIESRPLSADLFSPPGGYTQTRMQQN